VTAAHGFSSASTGSPETSFPISASPPSELADQTNLLNAIIDSPEQGRTINRYMSLEVALFSQSRIIGRLVWPGLGSIDLWRRKIGAEIVGRLVPAGVLDFLMTDYSKDLFLPLVGTVENLDAAQRSHSESVGAKLEAAARWDLLDLGMRNPLLNYRLAAFPGLRTAGPSSTRPDRPALRRRPGQGLGPEEQAQSEAPEIQSE
jgi:hypothetical protein